MTVNAVALISTPWPLFDRPSIQLGTLKAFVRENAPDVRVDLVHAYLRIASELGYDRYAAIAERSLLEEELRHREGRKEALEQ